MLKTTEKLEQSYIDELKGNWNGPPVGWYLRSILEIGNFYNKVTDYESVFGLGSVHVVDGHNEIDNPNEEFRFLLDYLGLDPELIHLTFNPGKGFYCLEKPLRFCLSEEKGHRNKSFSLYEAFPEMKVLKNGYRNQIVKLYKHIYKCESEAECCLKEEQRFAWMKDYFCS